MSELDKIKRAIRLLNARASNHMTGVVPPVPVFGYCEIPAENGKIIGAILPADGKITKLCLGVSEYLKPGLANFTVGLTQDDTLQTVNFSTRKDVLAQKLELDVKEGAVITLSVEDPDMVKGLMTSFLYQIGHKDSIEIKIDYNSLGIGDEGIRQLIS